jgi:hypothetical protein
MTGRSVSDLLAPEVILREVSRVQLPGTVLSDLFNWGLPSRDPENMTGNMIDYDLREGSYDVFNRSKEIATGSVPGTSNTLVKPQKVGRVRFTIPRTAESIPLTDEDLVNRRATGQPVTNVDSMGENYIMRQKQYLASKVGNMIEFQTAALLRGSYTFDQNGDELRQGFTGGETTIDFQIPAGNKDQLDMLGDGDIIGTTWATTSTDIPLDCMQVNDAMNSLTGMGIEHAICNSTTFQYLLNNLKIQAQAGTSNTPFQEYNRTGPGRFSVVFRAIPWLQWHIIDYRLDIWNGSTLVNTKLVADDQVTFIPTPNSNWVQYLNGGEVITEGPNGTRAFRHGYYAYGYPTWDPSGWKLNNNHNGFPALYIPAAIATADVTP